METKDVIRTNRLRLGLTEQQLADRVGVSRGSVQQWEKGTTAPKRGNQDAVAAALGIDKALLMGLHAHTTPNVKFSMGDDQAPIVQALESLDQHLKALAPVFQDSGREVLRKWAVGAATVEEVANALEAMALASETLGNKNST
jgi:transcriptional regulator with XRE-family HTH domain